MINYTTTTNSSGKPSSTCALQGHKASDMARAEQLETQPTTPWSQNGEVAAHDAFYLINGS